MARRDEIVGYCDERLRSAEFQDVAVNGLQVSGRLQIDRLAVAVSTSQQTLSEAANWRADALLVHHGLLWGGKLGPIAGVFADRLRLLFEHEMSLIAYHLPLDSHPEIGNCARLCIACGFMPTARFANAGAEPLGIVGEWPQGYSLDRLVGTLADVTEREPVVVGIDDGERQIERAGFLTGSGYGALQEAAGAGCQALVTGDIRESTMAEARELGISVIAAGHEATERLGVQALAAELAGRFGIVTQFIDDPNPV
ncbi:MAG: Nif3-like dinuclear metal center hexameric protein [Chloroflexota bacterium]|nr:Nif3-like dinuclear metal center hexameric protein [Chloroflexota bacterium]